MKTNNCGEINKDNVSNEITLCGWVDTIRTSGKISFIVLRDRTGIVQIFMNKDLTEQAKDLKKEAVIQIKGIVNARPENQVKKEIATGEIEIEAKELNILNNSEAPLPIEMSEETTTSIDKRLDYRFLDLRREKIKNIFVIRSKIYSSTVNFFENEKFIAVQSPKLTASGVESGAEEFKIPYFEKTAALAQSPQVYKQMFVASGLERVYDIGTVFRAEKSHTTRHLTEFTGIDFEMAFTKDENDIMDMVEKFLQSVLTNIKTKCEKELETLKVQINVPDKIPRISMIEAREILKAKGKNIPEDEDLDPEGEKMFSEYVKEKHDCDFVFLTDFPWTKRPFYHMRPEDKKLTKSFDLLYKGVEIATGAQREHRLDVLEAQCKEKGLDLNKLDFYKNIFRFGCPPHGGVGLGLDRITSRMLDLENVREAILLPRDPERLTP
ncbi:aspartate--tRNA(Asn) ligase [archaeon]|jgi:nondiscriminating aspartyl-tRNA synthetase|nr:aspartate--tRNA(Asn) ligase [archaeon]MBT3730644.1 aspartate--tRNA(Asn) ligase [archaeon]MBT8010657.1 aspartate--tRNA(Asn) ligase [archaeon]